MKMSKTVRRMNDKLLGALKTLSVFASEELSGFTKLEHTVAFDLFPGSLVVTCYFTDQDALDKNMCEQKTVQKKLQRLLLKQGIVLKDVKQNLIFSL